MRTRLIVFVIGVILFFLAVFLIFATNPSNNKPVDVIAPPTVNPAERLSGETLDGQLLFSRGGLLWAWRGDGARRLAIEPGQSVVANNRPQLLQPAMAPAGNAIAYIRQDESFSDLWLVNSDGTNSHSLTSNRGPGLPRSAGFADGSLWAFSPAWSPDGSTLAFLWDKGTDDLGLWVTPVKNFAPRRVASVGAGQGGISRPIWTSDGTRLIFTAYENLKPQIWRVNLQTGNLLKITNFADGAYDPALSPDGQSIAYIARKGNSSELWLMTADGDNPLLLASMPARGPAWSTDGSKVAFLGLKDDSFEIFTVAVAAGKPGAVKQISKQAGIDGNSGLTWTK